MKLNKKLSFLAVTALAAVTALTSCSDDKYWDENGIAGQGVTFDRKAMTANFKPGEEIPSPVFNVVVRRGTTSGTETVTVEGFTADSKGDYTIPTTSSDPWTYGTTATFADGSNTATIPVTLTTAAEGTYRMALKITSTSSLALGSNSTVVLTVSISAGDPQPIWRTLGKGKLTFALFNLPTGNAEVQVDDAAWPEGSKGYYGHYRIYYPYEYLMDEGENYADYVAAGWPEAIEFYIFPPEYSAPFWNFAGTNAEGITFTNDTDMTLALMKNYVLPLAVFEGSTYTTCSTPVYFSTWDGNDSFHQAVSVLDGWIVEPDYEATPGTDEFRGIPNAVGLGCYIFIDDTTSGNANYVNYKRANFIFPGGSLGDYTFDLSYFGHSFNADKTKEYLTASITANGSDCRDFIVGLVQTNSAQTAATIVESYWQDRLKAEDPDAVAMPSTLFGFSEATITEGNTEDFRYEVPQESTNYTFVAFSLNDGAIAETATVGVKFQSITEMGGEDANWDNLGMGQMTDDMLLEYYCEDGILEPGDIIAYDVPVQKHKTEAGKYRVVTPYSAEYFPFNLGGFQPSDDNMIIDATNPQCVKIPTFSVGILPFSTPAELLLESSSYYYSENGISDAAIINAGIAGTLVNNVVSFPAEIQDAEGSLTSMLGFLPTLTSAPQLANTQGEFKVVLPGASKAARKVTAKSRKITKRLHKPSLDGFKALSYSSKAGNVSVKNPKAVKKFRVPMALPHQLR